MKDSRLPEKKKVELFDLIYNLIIEKPNNYDLGEAVRNLIQQQEKK